MCQLSQLRLSIRQTLIYIALNFLISRCMKKSEFVCYQYAALPRLPTLSQYPTAFTLLAFSSHSYNIYYLRSETSSGVSIDVKGD